MGKENLISKVAVRVKTKGKYTGSGYVYLPSEESEWIYILTAKHCIYGKSFKAKPILKQILISRKKTESSEILSSYSLLDTDSIIVKNENSPDILALKLKRESLEGALGRFPVTYLSNYEYSELVGVFKGFPSLTNNEIPLTSGVEIISQDSEGANIHAQCNNDFSDENTSGDYNVEGYSGSGLCIEVNEKLFLIGLISKYSEAGRRFEASKIAPWMEEMIAGISIYSAKEERLVPYSLAFKQNKLAISALGPRYSPELNLKLKIGENFDTLALTSAKKEELQSNLNLLVEVYKGLLDSYSKLGKIEKSSFNRKKQTITFGYNTKGNLFTGKEIILKIGELIAYFSEAFNSSRLLELDWNEIRKKQRQSYDFGYGMYNIMYSLKSHFISTTVQFDDFDKAVSIFSREAERFIGAGQNFDKSLILIEGEPGSGKSHLLADIVTQRTEANKFTLLFLGQNFDGIHRPWDQILTQLGCSCELTSFLEIIDAKGRRINERVFIMIDAINEGEGIVSWRDGFRNFVDAIKPYQYIGLVISYRTTYRDFLFQATELQDIFIIRHSGFSGFEREAFISFAKHYELPIDSVPMLNKEFGNPLFLKLLCIGLKKDQANIRDFKKIGIDRIFQYYIEYVNREIGKHKEFGYAWHKINHVKRVLDFYTAKVVKIEDRNLDYEDAFLLTEDVVHRFLGKPGFLDKLIDENIFIDTIKYISRTDLRYQVTYAYDRLGDHLMAKELIASLPDPLNPNWHNQGMFKTILSDAQSNKLNQGLIDALSIQLPEQRQKEFWEVLPKEKQYAPAIVRAFYKSFSWRTAKVDSEKLEAFTQGYIETEGLSKNSFYDELIDMCLETDQPFNAFFLHGMLSDFSMADRDASWNIYLNDRYSDNQVGSEINVVKRLLKWAWKINDGIVYDEETVSLAVTALGWFLTSTNRTLRDISTKVLIHIFLTYQDHLLTWVEKFRMVNDPYVTQRVYAIAYGCAVKSSGEFLKSIADYIYKNFFETSEIIPDILARDYARSIIEYAVFRKVGIYNVREIRPPYNSSLESKLPANKEIALMEEKIGEGSAGKFNAGISILNSMITEKGRDGRMYGDFGRYVFQSALRPWKNANIQGLSNLAVKYIFDKYGYNIDKHGSFDREGGYNARIGKRLNERIGKKYQWIAFYEILARVADNDLSFSYNGPWEPYVRDIDPTFLENPEKAKIHLDFDVPDFAVWKDVPDPEWMSSHRYAFDPLSVISFKENNKPEIEWLALEANESYSSSNKSGAFDFSTPYKDFYYQLRSYLVAEDSYYSITNRLMTEDFMGRWMPEAHTVHELLNREFYWSPAFKDFIKENPEWRNIQVNRKYIGSVAPTAIDFLWEEEFDNSKDQVTNFHKPSMELFKALELEYGQEEGEFVNSKGEVVCFDPHVRHDSKSRLLVERKILEKQLKKKGLRIFWTVLGKGE
ncbi:hypothetical protein G7074_15865 [Pedobacter sp. HDW13]|uniref:ATP-binding protein n=1 Tax=Pedobacter sp. HDW13 TaxID=2714940 RepID=UPI00140D62CB|nr:ATP-binding protein [Pedobacter sp. HDW13]QIL40613.1 hypothetical protein G7074_15865 [Pedobacter sp. HDW13]